jgi:hypothetical protein
VITCMMVFSVAIPFELFSPCAKRAWLLTFISFFLANLLRRAAQSGRLFVSTRLSSWTPDASFLPVYGYG